MRLEDYREKLKDLSSNKLSFGNAYLDDACDGILKNDLIIIAAPSGMGKSEQAAAIGYYNAKNGKKVYMFALEAFKYEIEARCVFREAMNCYYNDPMNEYIPFGFLKYINDEVPIKLKKYIEDAENSMRVLSKTFKIKYPDPLYKIQDFEKDLIKISLDADLIIIDHLHYFDIDGKNENLEITNIVKKLRELVLVSDIPIILVSHVRKNNVIKAKIIPGQEDLHGTSNIAKIATKIIVITPDFTRESGKSYVYPTWIRVGKNRFNGSVTRYCASIGYNITKNNYSKKYFLHKLNFDETNTVEVLANFPDWVKNRSSFYGSI